MTSDAYKENYDKIFKGRNRPETGSWVWHPETMELIPKDEYVPPQSRRGPMIMKGMEEFKSPIDGSVISDRRKLQEHNRQHGVTNLADYGENNGKSYFERKAAEREAVLSGKTDKAKRERVETIVESMRRHGM